MILTAIKTGLIFAALAGVILGLELGVVGGVAEYPLDSFILILYVSAALAVLATVCSLLLGLLSSAISRIIDRQVQPHVYSAFCFGLGIALVTFSQAGLGWVELNRPVGIDEPRTILTLLGLLAACALLGWAAARLIMRRYQAAGGGTGLRIASKPYYALPAFLLLAILAAWSGSIITGNHPTHPAIPETGDTRTRVVFLGVDAATWDLVDEFRSNGKLPNLARLVRRGAYGNLESYVSTYDPTSTSLTGGIKSPAAWTSMFTGKAPAKHGIRNFIYAMIPGISHPFRHPMPPLAVPGRSKLIRLFGIREKPFTSRLRKTKAIWNILSDTGNRVACLGWFTTWPAEKVNGVFLSDRFHEPDLPRRWFPRSLLEHERVDSLIDKLEHHDERVIRYLTDGQYRSGPKQAEPDPALISLAKTWHVDDFRGDLGLELQSRETYDFLSVFFYGLDVAGHSFWKYMRPDLFQHVDMENTAHLKDVIENYYRYIDAKIGAYLELADENTTFVIVSDHGMGPWLGGRLMSRAMGRYSGNHRRDGIIIIAGPGIREGEQIEGASILDVTPTVLYLMGLPVARDMDGRVLTEAVRDDVLRANPVEYIPTYETSEWQYEPLEDVPDEKDADQRIFNRLRALGYIN